MNHLKAKWTAYIQEELSLVDGVYVDLEKPVPPRSPVGNLFLCCNILLHVVKEQRDGVALQL